MKSYGVTIQMSYWAVLSCGTVYYAVHVQGSSNFWVWMKIILKCDHSYESYWAVFSGTVYNAVKGGSNFWHCGWHPKVWPFKSKWLSIVLKSIWCIFGVGQFKINHMWIIQQHSFYQKAATICFIWNFLHTGTPGTPTVVMVGFPGGPGGPMGPRSPGGPRRPWSPCWEENPKSS